MTKSIALPITLLLLAIGGVSLLVARPALADSFAIYWSYNDTTGDKTIPVYPSTVDPQLLGTDPTSHQPTAYGIGPTLALSSGVLGVTNLEIFHTNGLQAALDSKASTSSLASTNSTVSSLSSTVTSHSSALATIQALTAQINANLYGTSTTMTFANASTTHGLMSAADKAKLDSLTAASGWTWNTPSRSIVTGTGATGFQPSSSQTSTVHYDVTVTTTATIAGNSGGYVLLEVAPTNSATAGDWVEMGRCGNSQAISLAITLQSVQGTSCQLNADIPAGYYAKLRSVTSAGTPSYVLNSTSEVLK